MLINALCDYYDILSESAQVLPEGYSGVNIHYLVSISPDGKIDSITNCQVKSVNRAGKEILIPKTIILPKRSEKSAIGANVAEHRPTYIFGLIYDNKGKQFINDDKTSRAKKSFESFKTESLKFYENLSSPLIEAYKCYISNWNPQDEKENSWLVNIGNKVGTSGFAFCLSGHPDEILGADSVTKAEWDRITTSQPAVNDAVVSQCSITGKVDSIAKTHRKIKGISGGLSTGMVMVGCNNPAECSYGKEQSYNSNISEVAMYKYTGALNYLLGSKSNVLILDDVTIIFWAMSPKKEYVDIVSSLFSGNPTGMDEEQTQNMLGKMMEDAREGNIIYDRISSENGIDENVDFYFLGLKPNSSRIAVKFFYKRRFGEILQNIAQHQNDLQIITDKSPVPLWKIKSELVSPHVKGDKMSPAIETKLIESILYGIPYPDALLQTAIMRSRIDADKAMNNVRAGIIKACLNRQFRRNGKEEITLALDLNNTTPAYVCGRLFATLEKLQSAASGGKLNRTIKSTYFASAASKPAMVFPKLLKLAQNHLDKLDSPVFYNKLIQELVGKINGEFPETLLLNEQGMFMIGYYHQMEAFYTKRVTVNSDESDNIAKGE